MGPAADLGELERTATTEDLLRATCRVLTRTTDAQACVLSRVLGEVLIQVAEWWNVGESRRLGHGYLLAEYPMTAQVLDRVEPRAVSLLEPDADASEASVLEELGFDSVLMLPLVVEGTSWALVELYVSGRPFGVADLGAAQPIVQRAGEILAQRLRNE